MEKSVSRKKSTSQNCIICLRNVNSFDQLKLKSKNSRKNHVDNGARDSVDEVSPELLSTFQSLLPFITNHVETPPEQSSVEKPPPICQFCADKVQNVESLVNAVKAELSDLTTRTNDGMGNFVGQLRGVEMSSDVIESTLHFLSDSGGGGGEDGSCVSGDALENGGEVKFELDVDVQDEEDLYHQPIKIEVGDDENVDEQTEEEDTDESSSGGGGIDSEQEDEEEPEFEVSGSQSDDNYIADPLGGEDSSDSEEDTLKNKKSEIKKSGKSSSPPKPAMTLNCEVKGCQKTFKNLPMLHHHYRMKHPEYAVELGLVQKPKIKCQVENCSRSFSCERSLKQHCKLAHPGIIPDTHVLCNLCGDQVLMSKSEDHMRNHVGDYARKCPYTPDCTFIASNPKDLRDHYWSNIACRREASVNNRDSICETCGFKVDHVLTIRTHLRQYHERSLETGESGFKCPMANCSEIFCTRQSVWFHLESHCCVRKEDSQKCMFENCGKVVKVEEMEEHLKIYHQVQDIIKCDQCPFLFTSQVGLLEHLYDHRKTGMFCPICKDGVKYQTHFELRKHCRSSHDGLDVNLFVCEICSYSFCRKSGLAGHLRKKHNQDVSSLVKARVRGKRKNTEEIASSSSSKNKRFPCDICVETRVAFATNSSLVYHNIVVHGAEPYTCKICGKKFKRQTNFNRHKREHAGVKLPEKEFKCKVVGCGKVCNSHSALSHHRKRDHDLGNKVTCKDCGKVFIRGLKEHWEAVHSGTRRFICDLCGKGFLWGNKLKRHKMDVHKIQEEEAN